MFNLLAIKQRLYLQMVRKYQRTTQRAKWTEEAMKAAIDDIVNNKKKLREASRAYSIPVMTLSDRLKTGDSKKLNLGHKPVFTKEQEHEIAEQVLLLAKVFYGISSVELRRLVFEYAEKNGVPNKFDKSAKLAGQDWLKGFLKRNPGISIRKPEATSMSRITAFNKVEVDLFFSNLKTEMDKHNFTASKIYNFDETGVSTVQKPGKILGPKGAKQLGAATSWERGKNITVGCAMSAAGQYIPPMFIFPRKRMSPNLTKGGPPNAIYHCSDNGWITEELFIVWLHHFILHAKPTKEDPVLLVMDNHKTHTTLAAYNLCKENGIIVVTLPPHSSHRLQPLDITFYSSLKAAFNKECDNFLRSHHLEKITPYEISAIFNHAYIKVANIAKGVSGFASAGIFPLNPERFSDEDFAMRLEVELGLPIIEDRDPENCVGSRDTSASEVENSQNSTQMDMDPVEDLGLTSNKQKTIASLQKAPTMLLPTPPQPKSVSFKSICPTPQSSMKKATSRQQHSVIFTESPNKSKLEESAKIKELKKQIQQLQAKLKSKVEGQKKPRQSRPKKTSKILKPATGSRQCKIRRNIKFEDSSSDDNLPDTDIFQDDELDDIDPKQSFIEKGVLRQACGSKDTCILCGDFGKDNELWFRCCSCAGWIHAACSASESADNFICDLCTTINV